MTADQIEAAARELCRMRGMDPDESVPHALFNTYEAWHVVADEIRTFAEVGTAIASVMQEPPKKARKRKDQP